MMVETLFQKDVRIKRITTLGYAAAQALNDPVRIKILEILSHNQMSADGIAKTLGSSGYKKATTTIRHHLDILKGAGLIEAARMVEVRGAVMKYYAPTIRAFGYESPDFDKHLKLIEDSGAKMLKILKIVLNDKKFASAFAGKSSCSQCKADHFKEFAALEILNASLAKAMEREEYLELLSGKIAAANGSIRR